MTRMTRINGDCYDCDPRVDLPRPGKHQVSDEHHTARARGDDAHIRAAQISDASWAFVADVLRRGRRCAAHSAGGVGPATDRPDQIPMRMEERICLHRGTGQRRKTVELPYRARLGLRGCFRARLAAQYGWG